MAVERWAGDRLDGEVPSVSSKVLSTRYPVLGFECLILEMVVADVMDDSNVDLAMLAQFNSNERTATAFKNVFHQADPRFQVVDIKKPRGSAMAIIEVVWRSGVGD